MSKLKFRLMVERDGEPAPGKTARDFSRQLRITALTLLLSIALLIAVTVAWFASNREVKSDSMQIEVETTANLVIVPVSPGPASGSYTAITAATSMNDTASFDVAAQTLIPATHDWTVGTATGLKYNDNNSNISRSTGYAASGTISLAAVPAFQNDDTNRYYMDYIVHIAADGTAMETASLTATLDAYLATDASKTPIAINSLQPYQRAASVDFYVLPNDSTMPSSSNNSTTYKGTLNLAKKDYAHTDSDSDNAVDTVESITLLTPTSGTSFNIPEKATDHITVLMRFYFDGNLRENDLNATPATAYVNSAELSTRNMPNLKVTFNATAPSA